MAAESAAPTIDELGEYVVHHLMDGQRWSPFPGVHLEVPRFMLLNIGALQMGTSFHVLMLFFAVALIALCFIVFYKKDATKAPRGLTNALEYLVVFVRNEVCLKTMGEHWGRKFTPYMLTLFFFIFFLNYMSLVPIFGTAMANVNITGSLALLTLAIMLIGGLAVNGVVGFFKIFLPPNVPKPILPLLFVIEIANVPIRIFALTIRLFANMFGGHMVIGILIGLIIAFGGWGMLTFPLILFVYVLEVLVAFLQAYIFTMLSAVFITGMLHPEH